MIWEATSVWLHQSYRHHNFALEGRGLLRSHGAPDERQTMDCHNGGFASWKGTKSKINQKVWAPSRPRHPPSPTPPIPTPPIQGRRHLKNLCHLVPIILCICLLDTHGQGKIDHLCGMCFLCRTWWSREAGRSAGGSCSGNGWKAEKRGGGQQETWKWPSYG